MDRIEKIMVGLLALSAFVLGSAGTGGFTDKALADVITETEAPPLKSEKSTVLLRENKASESDTVVLPVLAAEPEGYLWLSETVTEAEFCEQLGAKSTGTEEGVLTRERAAYIVYTYLLRDGYEKSEYPGNLSMYKDGLEVTPEYMEAYAKLIVLGVIIAEGPELRPQAELSVSEATEILKRVQNLESGVTDAENLILSGLGIDREGKVELEAMLSELVSMMIENGTDSLSVAQGDISAIKAQQPEQSAYELKIGLVKDGADNSLIVYCTVSRDNVYFCTADITLLNKPGSPDTLSAAYVKLSFG